MSKFRSYRKKGPGRKHVYGPGGGFKIRKRVVRGEGTLNNPFCPTNNSTDPCWKLSLFAMRERLGLPHNVDAVLDEVEQ